MRYRFLLASFIMAATLQAQPVLKLNVDLAETTATEKIYNFAVDDFEGVIGWQFSMHYDGARIKYKEVRNSVLNYLSTGSFFEPTPGELRSVWLDNDLTPNNFPDPTVVFQLVFELLDTDSTPLCFEESEEYFEFIVDEGGGSFTLSEIVIHDDCNTGLSIFLDPSATDAPEATPVDLIRDAYLSTTGTLSFSATHDQELTISLFDLNGVELNAYNSKEYPAGRQSVLCRPLVPGLYVLKAKGGDGREQVMKVFAY